MPLPTQLLLTFVTGVAAALAARTELRVSPRPALLCQSFAAYLAYAALVLVPVSLYFYVFHGDWYLMYLLDVQRVPSALVLVGCGVQLALGTGGFLLGAILIRAQRDQIAGAAIGLGVAAAAAVVALARDRLSLVGTYAQFQGDFGLKEYGGALLQGSLWMTLWVVLGLGFLLYRLGVAARA